MFNLKISTSEIWWNKWYLIYVIRFHDWSQTWSDAMGNPKPSNNAWPTIAQSWNKVFDIIVLTIFLTPFMKVGHGIKDPISIHSNVAHLSSSMMELLASYWISTSSIQSLLISCQSENFRAQNSTSHISMKNHVHKDYTTLQL
jgi:hypothetical protein